MNKQEFLQAINNLKYKGSYSETNSWEKERAFDKCKEEIIELAYQLDEQGLTIEAYNLFRQQTNDLTIVYTELFKVQNELFKVNKQLLNIETEKQHRERLNAEQIENVRKGALTEVFDCLRILSVSDGKAISAKGYIDLAEFEKTISEKFNFDISKIS